MSFLSQPQQKTFLFPSSPSWLFFQFSNTKQNLFLCRMTLSPPCLRSKVDLVMMFQICHWLLLEKYAKFQTSLTAFLRWCGHLYRCSSPLWLLFQSVHLAAAHFTFYRPLLLIIISTWFLNNFCLTGLLPVSHDPHKFPPKCWPLIGVGITLCILGRFGHFW